MDDSGSVQLSVVVVNYNVKYFLEQCLLSIRRAQRGLNVEVWVVDNQSADDSVVMVEEKFPEVRLIANANNPGFSMANNQAIRQAKGKYILLLNPDTVVGEDTFSKTLNFMEAHPEAGGLGVKMIDGAGVFLPESRRGFPSPFVAFAKTFGLARLFPKSKRFNRYHLGYLDAEQTHEADVLSGAFMLMRKSVLDEIGLLDEQFFMYGEDIDLSYRIQLAGYKNYYFPETTIIHYKGESTKKGSLNYVRTFYHAMILFARKHFQGQQAFWFIRMLQAAIYFRAGLTLVANFFKNAYWPLVDAALLYGGLAFLKNIWALYRYDDLHYFQPVFLYFNAPLYVSIWLIALFFSGGYDARSSVGQLVRGILAGTVTIAAVYGFLNLEYRSSRAIIVLGTLWALALLPSLRLLRHFIKEGNFDLSNTTEKRLLIIGSPPEIRRTQDLLNQARVRKNLIGVVELNNAVFSLQHLGSLDQLEVLTKIYHIDELVFCAKDMANQVIMHWMMQLGAKLEYKILPEDSQTIIGSSSKDQSGELYTVDVRFQIASPRNRREKRLFDIISAGLIGLFFPLQWLFVSKKRLELSQCLAVITGKKSWVGYHAIFGGNVDLPQLRAGVLTPLSGLGLPKADESTIRRLNFLYAKDYIWQEDLRILWREYRF
jgi:GT2 family glycosyltransferase